MYKMGVLCLVHIYLIKSMKYACLGELPLYMLDTDLVPLAEYQDSSVVQHIHLLTSFNNIVKNQEL